MMITPRPFGRLPQLLVVASIVLFSAIAAWTYIGSPSLTAAQHRWEQWQIEREAREEAEALYEARHSKYVTLLRSEDKFTILLHPGECKHYATNCCAHITTSTPRRADGSAGCVEVWSGENGPFDDCGKGLIRLTDESRRICAKGETVAVTVSVSKW
jgi:hypothetical protein